MDARQRRHAEAAGRLLTVLGHPTRLLVVCLLLRRERCVQELLDELGGTKANLSQHLKLLTGLDLLARRRDGNRIHYRIKDPRLGRLVSGVKTLYCPALKIR